MLLVALEANVESILDIIAQGQTEETYVGVAARHNFRQIIVQIEFSLATGTLVGNSHSILRCRHHITDLSLKSLLVSQLTSGGLVGSHKARIDILLLVKGA